MRRSGFTLVELIVVMMIIGILAVAAMPRFQDAAFEQRGFHDETLAALRYAQKAAIAQRRNVCVNFAAGPPATVSLRIGATNGDDCNAPPCPAIPCSAPLQILSAAPFVVTARSNDIVIATVPGNVLPSTVSFDPLGRANLPQTMQVTGITDTITVERETGYVHE